MSQRFSAVLRKEAQPIWSQILEHPFLTEIAHGTLPNDKFRFYVMQDYPFLQEFARCLALAAAKSETIDSMRVFSSMLDSSLTYEFRMLEKLAQGIGIPTNVLREARPAPSCAAYSQYIVSIAYSCTIGEILASLLPCMWTYQEIAQGIGDSASLRSHPIYSEWCNTYLTSEYSDLVSRYRRMVDRLAKGLGRAMLERMKKHFLQSSRYEYLFWEMSYGMLDWPNSIL